MSYGQINSLHLIYHQFESKNTNNTFFNLIVNEFKHEVVNLESTLYPSVVLSNFENQ